MARFTFTERNIPAGKGCLETLKTLEGKRAMICVGGGSMKRNGFLDRAVEYLKEAGMEVQLYEGIEPDPSVETVMKGADCYAQSSSLTGLLLWAAVLLSMLQRLCGLSMNILIQHLRICARYSVFPSLRTEGSFLR